MAIGIWSAVGGVAAALGPPLGGLLVQLSWHWIFIVNVPIGLIAAASARASSTRSASPRTAAQTCSARRCWRPGSACSPSAIVKGPDWGWGDPRDIAAFAAAAALVLGFLYRSARHHAPVIELPLLRVRSFALANSATLVFFAGFGAMLLAGVLLLTELWGYWRCAPASPSPPGR